MVSDTQKRYRKENIRRLTWDFFKNTEADILQRLSEVPSRVAYVKALIRYDIKHDILNQDKKEE